MRAFVARGLRHLGAAVAPQQHHAVLRQPVQRLAHQGARDREGLGEFFLAQTRAGAEAVVDDGRVDGFVHAVGGLRRHHVHRRDAQPASALRRGDRQLPCQTGRRRDRRPIQAAATSARAITSNETAVVTVPSA